MPCPPTPQINIPPWLLCVSWRADVWFRGGRAEEPLPCDELVDYKWLVERSNVPIAAGEHEFTHKGFAELLAAGVKTLPLSCVLPPPVFVAKTLPLPCVSTAFVTETLPLPCAFSQPSWLRQCL